MADTFRINKRNTAVLILDVMNETVAKLGHEQQVMLLQRAKQALDGARRAGLLVIFVVVYFREGYPEVSPRNKLFDKAKNEGRFREGTSGTKVHPDLTPLEGEILLVKRRVNAFSTTELATILNSKDIHTIVLLGLATSGAVLSTARWAADIDYEVVILSDCCGEADEEVQRVLMQKVFPRQATVITAEQFLSSIS